MSSAKPLRPRADKPTHDKPAPDKSTQAKPVQDKPARRLVVLVRHGQYDTDLGDAGSLTPVGREQARLAGRFLCQAVVDRFFCSTMVRAEETADIIGHEIRSAAKRSPLLCEGFPTRLRGYDSENFKADRKRFEQAFERFFKVPRARTTDVIVCHGNIIRYFVCRALGAKVSKWSNLGTNHAGFTRIVVRADGQVGLASFNDVSYMPRRMVT
jgi:serine/threonine-protein phosphatase PGAM5